MRKYRSIFILLTLSTFLSEAYSLTSDFLYAQDSTLTALLAENSYELTIANNQILGADSLLKSAQESEVFLFGENHGVQEIASFAQLIYEVLSLQEPRVLVTEIGPATASEVERLVREDSFEEFMESGTNLHSVPFFFLNQEVPLLKSTTNSFNETDYPVIWGLDQEFIAGAPVVFRHLERLATTNEEKNALRKVRRKAFFNPFLIGMGSGEALKELDEVFQKSTSPEARRITEQLVLSHKIYKEQMGGDVRWSNERRETLMMENFQAYVNLLPDSVPPLFFKFGSYHLHTGKSPTVKEALGFRIDQWTKANNLSTVSVMVDAVSGETLDALMGGKTELASIGLWKRSPFYPLVNEKPVLFDLRAVKRHPQVTDLSKKLQLMIAGYDFLVLFPVATSQEFLDGTLVTHAYGIAIVGLVILVLFLIVFFLVKWIKKRRRKRKMKRS